MCNSHKDLNKETITLLREDAVLTKIVVARTTSVQRSSLGEPSSGAVSLRTTIASIIRDWSVELSETTALRTIVHDAVRT